MTSVQELLSNPSALPFVEVSPIKPLLPDNVMAELRDVVDPMAESHEKGKDLFTKTINFVGDYLTSRI